MLFANDRAKCSKQANDDDDNNHNNTSIDHNDKSRCTLRLSSANSQGMRLLQTDTSQFPMPDPKKSSDSSSGPLGASGMGHAAWRTLSLSMPSMMRSIMGIQETAR